METRQEAKKMNLERGRLVLMDRYGERLYWPDGVGRRFVMGDQIINESPRFTVKFLNHHYSTTDPEIAMAMANLDDNFDQSWGFRVDPACLPEEIREVWQRIGTADRQAVLRLLVVGDSAENALNAIRGPIEQPRVEKVPELLRTEIPCPITGCQQVAKGKHAREALRKHIAIMHPEVDPSVAKTI